MSSCVLWFVLMCLMMYLNVWISPKGKSKYDDLIRSWDEDEKKLQEQLAEAQQCWQILMLVQSLKLAVSYVLRVLCSQNLWLVFLILIEAQKKKEEAAQAAKLQDEKSGAKKALMQEYQTTNTLSRKFVRMRDDLSMLAP